MLRPATPLTILFLIAFALLLISTISTPIIKGIPLGSYDSCNFGVFGYCTPQNCSSISISYDTSMYAMTKMAEEHADRFPQVFVAAAAVRACLPPHGTHCLQSSSYILLQLSSIWFALSSQVPHISILLDILRLISCGFSSSASPHCS